MLKDADSCQGFNRYAILSEKLLEVLRDDQRQYRPEKWLFEGARDEIYLGVIKSPLDSMSLYEGGKR